MNEVKYQSGHYKRLHERYPQLWHVLSNPLMVERMKVLSRQGLPAVLALDFEASPVWEILRAAKHGAEFDAVKRMIGHQVKQIMDSNGYHKNFTSKPIRSSWIFSSGAVYGRPEWRRIHVFRNPDASAQSRFCLAQKRRLTALSKPPKQSSIWKYYRMCRTRTELNFVIDGNIDDDYGLSWLNLCDTISQEGFVILRD